MAKGNTDFFCAHVFTFLFAVCTFQLLNTAFSQDQTQVILQYQKAAKKAIKNGIDSSFIVKMTSSSDAGFVERAVRINLTNYHKPPDYSSHYNKKSVKAVKVFLKQNKKLMNAVQKKTNVRKEAIAAIMWIESRCGQITGTYHVPSVFISLMLASDSVYVDKSMQTVTENLDLDSTQLDSVRNLILNRSARKIDWALKELNALAVIDKRNVMDVTNLHGSWAGAFGYPQFLPSSFMRFATDGNGDGKIDLYTVPDAVYSIGNYLQKNGWGKKRSMQRKAVYSYNNSDAYVNAVFTLAKKLR